MTLNNKYNIGDFVYQRADNECLVYQITAIIVECYGFHYKIEGNGTELHLYEFQITSEKNILPTLN